MTQPSGSSLPLQCFRRLQKSRPTRSTSCNVSASPESAVRYLETVVDFDVRYLLAQVKAPTLVMHVRDERRVPVALGREMAAGIPNARFVALPGKNHVLLEQDPGMPIFLEELRNFLS